MKLNKYNTNSKIVNNTSTFDYTGIGVLNVFLAATVIFLVIYYVFVSNVITSSNYKIGILNEELSGLIGSNGVLTANKLSIEDSSTILNFAESYDMVEAKHTTHRHKKIRSHTGRIFYRRYNPKIR